MLAILGAFAGLYALAWRYLEPKPLSPRLPRTDDLAALLH
jgi:hypothetical protein